MIAVLAFGMTGCVKTEKADIKQLKQIEGDMLVITGYPQVAMTEEMYKQAITRMRFTYKGVAYNPNPINEEGVTVPDDEYLRIYEFCKDAVAKNKFANYSENVDDGTTYKFVFYDTDGSEHVIYDGYCYDNKELREIMSLISKYQVD